MGSIDLVNSLEKYATYKGVFATSFRLPHRNKRHCQGICVGVYSAVLGSHLPGMVHEHEVVVLMQTFNHYGEI